MKNTNMRYLKAMLIFSFVALLAINGSAKVNDRFAKMKESYFVVNDKPYYFIGTNFWYGAVLGSKGEGGDRERLIRELDFMKANGINNIRVLIGSDGENGVPSKVEPTLQKNRVCITTPSLTDLIFCCLS